MQPGAQRWHFNPRPAGMGRYQRSPPATTATQKLQRRDAAKCVDYDDSNSDEERRWFSV